MTRENKGQVFEGRMPNREAEFVPTSKWVRVYFGDELIADSRRVKILRQIVRTPVYYFPESDVRMEFLEKSDHTKKSPLKGTAKYWHVRVGDRLAENAAWTYIEPSDRAPELEGYIAFEWEAMDAWFEEDEQVYTHARDPYHRIDVLNSSRHVKISLDGETLAETRSPVLLFETGLPVRYYIPKLDVRLKLLESSETHTECPYKGTASYYSVKVGDELKKDLVWYYPFPTPEMSKIQNMLAFFDERLDVYVDGELQERPKTPWSE